MLPRSGDETPDFIFRLCLPLNHRQATTNPATAARAAVKMKVVMTAAAMSTEQSAEPVLVITEGGDGVCEGFEVRGTSVGIVVEAGSVSGDGVCEVGGTSVGIIVEAGSGRQFYICVSGIYCKYCALIPYSQHNNADCFAQCLFQNSAPVTFGA